MAENSFEEFQRRIQELYQQQKYTQAYTLARENTGRFPEQTPIVNYWRLCMAVRTGAGDMPAPLPVSPLRFLVWSTYCRAKPLVRRPQATRSSNPAKNRVPA
jgi:hypothetical protein